MLKLLKTGLRSKRIAQRLKSGQKLIQKLYEDVDRMAEELAHIETLRRMAEHKAGNAKYMSFDEVKRKTRQLLAKK
jgi:DNA anti-recombination protein RmuC